MPLLKKKAFKPRSPPEDIRQDDEIFYCPLTNEIFRDYNDFFERIILCNSMVWTCSVSGKPNLTFQEALDCEKKALLNIDSIPKSLIRPLLQIVMETYRGRLADLEDDVFWLAKDRYFIGEVLDAVHDGERFECRIVSIKPGACPYYSENEPPNSLPFEDLPDPYYVDYIVEPLYDIESKQTRVTVDWQHITRKKGAYTRDKNKLFLKQYCQVIGDRWQVKTQYVSKFRLKDRGYTDFWLPPRPIYDKTPVMSKTASPSKTPKRSPEEVVREKSSKNIKKDKERSGAQNAKPGGLDHKDHQEGLKKKQKTLEEVALEKQKLIEEAKKIMEVEKEKKRVEREKDRERKREEKERHLAWLRPRDDLECDDLKTLLKPMPVNLMVSNYLFGELAHVLEFLRTFGHLFNIDDEFGKDGIKLETLEKALVDNNPEGMLMELLKFLLKSVFDLQKEEEEDDEFDDDIDDYDKPLLTTLDQTDYDEMIESATVAAGWAQRCQGQSLRDIPIDYFTISELIRLHFLSAGARPAPSAVKFRYQQRGGFTPIDDPGLTFRIQESDVIRKLSTQSVFDLSVDNILKLMSALCNQLLTFVAVRDTIEDAYDNVKQCRKNYYNLQQSEGKRMRGIERAKLKRRQEEKDRAEIERLDKLFPKDCSKEEHAGAAAESTKDSKATEVEGDDNAIIVQDSGIADKITDGNGVDELMDQDLFPEEVEKRKSTVKKQLDKFLVEAAVHAGNAAILPLGKDRVHRRYWIFPSIKALFVEEDLEFREVCSLMHDPDTICSASSDKENSSPEMVSNVASNTPTLRPHITNGVITEEKLHPLKEALPVPKKQPTITDFFGKRDSSNGKHESVNGALGALKVEPVLNGDVAMEFDDARVNGDCRLAGKVAVTPSKVEAVRSDSSLLDRVSSGEQRETWSFYHGTPEVYSALLACLNTRGYREGQLKLSLQSKQLKVLDAFTNCKAEELNVLLRSDTEKKRHQPKRGQQPSLIELLGDRPPHELLDLSLRDQILDLEDRLYHGNLGVLKVYDRAAWRAAIEQGNYDPQSAEICFAQTYASSHSDPTVACKDRLQDLKSDDCKEVTSRCSTPTLNSAQSARDLGAAVLQLERGIIHKFLRPPLGESVQQKKKRAKDAEKRAKERDDADSAEDEEDVRMTSQIERWESSLLVCTSISQLAIHLSTLEQSVEWSKSVLNVRCKLCRRKGDEENMLLCDGCDRGFHTTCLKPTLKKIPTGDWFCKECKPLDMPRTPRKQRRVIEESSSSEDEVVESESEEEEVEEEEGRRRSSRKKTTKPPSVHLFNGKRSSRPSSQRKRKQCYSTDEEDDESPPPKPSRSRTNKMMNHCEDLLRLLIQHKDAWPFLTPVNKREVPDYHMIIRQPMDFGTMKTKQNNLAYQSIDSFLADSELVFSNCYEYNLPDAQVSRCAARLKSFYEAKLHEFELTTELKKVTKRPKHH